jgi:hypothetical protein
MVLSQPGQAAQIWQRLRMEHYWEHYNRPSGQRFLGSMRIHREVVEQLLNTIASSFSHVQPFTFAHLNKRFSSDQQQHWIKITTLALSEYAYYDECDTGLWQGICDRLNLQNTQGVQKALRQILDRGFQLLGLIGTQQGNRYVSTLWLQSGIPQQNLKHFADLLQDISQEYSWWEISHAELEDLSDLLYDFCVDHHPQWGKLITFLKSSCSEEGTTVEPISGTLLQGIATVAQELERRGDSPTILQDISQREQFLQAYCLPVTFFLRNWDNLIQVLTPQEQNQTTRRGIIGLRKKPLALAFDIADSMDIQLCLPEQRLYCKDWKSLGGSYCKIVETSWDGDIDVGAGIVEIPAMSQIVHDCQSSWMWQLRSHISTSLAEWHCKGFSEDFPALIFNAWTGDRLLMEDGLKGSTEIICFVASSNRIELSAGIELLDSFVPCSIKGWRGQQLHLTVPEAQIIFHFSNSRQSLNWSQFQTEHPDLRGLRLKGKQAIYLEVPTIWHSPLTLSKSLNILIEDLTHRTMLSRPDETVTLAAAAGWQKIALSQWITQSGSYAVRLWNQGDRWCEQFEVRSSFELRQHLNSGLVQVCDRSQTPVTIPIQAPSSAEFWLCEITLRGLWPLEEVTLLLTNGEVTQRYRQQSSASGTLPINLAAWRDALPDSSQYALIYQHQGGDIQHLVSMGFEQVVKPAPPQQAPLVVPSLVSSPSPPKSQPKLTSQLIYQLELQNNTRAMRQAFSKSFTAELKKERLERSIRTIKDEILRDLIRVELSSQEDESVLREICQRIGGKLHMVINLRKWSH